MIYKTKNYFFQYYNRLNQENYAIDRVFAEFVDDQVDECQLNDYVRLITNKKLETVKYIYL